MEFSFNFIWDIFNSLITFGNTIWGLLNTELFGGKVYMWLGVVGVGVLVVSITLKLAGILE